MNRIFVLACATCLLAAAKPVITAKTGVQTLATVASKTTLARGSVFTITGTELGPVDTVNAELPYGQELAGVIVYLATPDNSSIVQAFVISASEKKITAMVPSSTAAGDYNVVVSNNGDMSEGFAVKVADRNFGLVTTTGMVGGSVVGRAWVPETESWQAIASRTSAKPGWLVELSAMGLGAIDTPDNELAPELNVIDGASLLFGGKEVAITYIGRDPEKPGYDKVRAVLPDDAPLGCLVLFQAKLDADHLSSTVSLPVANGEGTTLACVHPLGLSPDGQDALDAGGTIVTGGFGLLNQSISINMLGISLTTKTETISGSFERYNAAQWALHMASSDVGWAMNPNGCTLFTSDDTPLPDELEAKMVDAGKIHISGPNGLNQEVPQDPTTKSYNLILTSPTSGGGIPGLPPGLPFPIPGGGGTAAKDVIGAGAYTLKGDGGAVVGAFTSTLNVLDPITWSNKDDSQFSKVNRATDLTFLWTGGTDKAYVSATGLSRGPAPEDNSKIVVRTFICMAPATAGKITVPSSLLLQMPAANGTTPEAMGTVGLQHVPNEKGVAVIAAPLVDGGNIESSFFVWAYGSSKTLGYK